MTNKPGSGKYNLYILVITILLTLIFAETVLRFMPVLNSADWMPVTAKDTLLRHTPNNTIIYSKDWNFSNKTVRHSNNYGFLNDQDYKTQGDTVLVAVIGDSYVEAMLNEYDKTFYGLLSNSLNKKARVYSFGVSGAQLSQYLAWADFVNTEFNPDILVIPIIANDFDESFYKYKRTRGFHYFNESDRSGSIYSVERKDSFLRKIMLESSLGRYLFYHLNVGNHLKTLKNTIVKFLNNDDTPVRYIGNVVAEVPKKQEEDGYKATDLFLLNISKKSTLRSNNIVFVIDAVRPSIYNKDDLNNSVTSYWSKMREYFIKQSVDKGFNVIDMQSVFINNYNSNKAKFEYVNDGHWNDLAHELVFKEIYNHKVLKDIKSKQF